MNLSDQVSPPFKDCPKCHSKKYGILAIYPDPDLSESVVAQGCPDCRHMQRSILPRIKKEVIYLDQNIVSNLMYVADPNSPKHASALTNPHWSSLFEKLITLVKYNLVVCPYSDVHIEESLLGPGFHSLQFFQKLLSNKIGLKHHNLIQDIQVIRYFKNYLDGKLDTPPEMKESDSFDDDPNRWYFKSKVIDDFSLSYPLGGNEGESVRTVRKNAHNELEAGVYKRWKTSSGIPIKDWILEEAKAFGKEKLQWSEKYCIYLRNKKMGESQEKMEEPPGFSLILQMNSVAEKYGIDAENIGQTLSDFFNSEVMLKIPYIRLSSEYLASVARWLNEGAKSGQMTNPNKGMLSDSEALATFLPYCDAFFTDRMNDALFDRSPLKAEKTEFNTKIFSMTSVDKFVSYLDDIWLNADKSHLEMVRDIYDPKWLDSKVIIFPQSNPLPPNEA